MADRHLPSFLNNSPWPALQAGLSQAGDHAGLRREAAQAGVRGHPQRPGGLWAAWDTAAAVIARVSLASHVILLYSITIIFVRVQLERSLCCEEKAEA